MKEKDVYSELNSIRALMERSTKFISLNGLSGILAGIYALIGSYLGYRLVYREYSGLLLRDFYVNDLRVIWLLVLIAAVVLFLSLSTGVWLTIRKAKKRGENFWNPVSKRLLMSLAVPLLTGGLLMGILVLREEYSVIAPCCLIFYGLALVSGSHYTFTDVKWLGFLEIILGLLAALMPGYGLVFWVIGFGLLHILYGSIMHFKYDR